VWWGWAVSLERNCGFADDAQAMNSRSKPEKKRTRKMGVHPKQLLRNWRDDLLAVFDKAERDHDLTFHRGLPREAAFRRILGDFLPRKFGVATGYVVSAKGSWSRQADIILYDALEAPILAIDRERSIYVVPVESVFGIIEVKSTLTEKDLRAALRNAASFKSLARDKSQFACAVCYRLPEVADLKKHGGKRRFLEKCSRRLAGARSGVVLDSVLVLRAQNEIRPEIRNGTTHHWREMGAEALVWRDGQWISSTEMALMLFLDWLVGRLREGQRLPPDLDDYLFEVGVDIDAADEPDGR